MIRLIFAIAAMAVAADAAYGQRLDVTSIPGRTAQVSIEQGHVVLENVRIANPSSSWTTGTLYVSVRVTTGSESTSSGYHLFDVNHHPNVRGLVDLRRVRGTPDNGRLSPRRYLDIFRLTYPLRQPRAGTYYIHLAVYQWNPSLRDNGGRTQLGSVTFSRQWTFGSGGDSDDHGNARSSATRVALPSTTAGRIETGSDLDYFRFEVSVAGTVRIHTSGSLDTLGVLYDADGDALGNNDDSGAGYNFRIERNLAAGTYFVRVGSYGTATGAYTLHLAAAGGGGSSSDDHGNARASATRVALPSTTAGRIETGSDLDYFRFEVSVAGTVRIHTSGSLDTLGVLYDADGDALGNNDDSGAGRNFRIERNLAAGTYFVRVRSYGTATGAYTLHLAAAGGGGSSSDDHGNARSSATRVALPSTTAGRIETGSDLDYFRFEVSVAGTVGIHTSGSLDTLGVLYDADGDALGNNDDSGAGYNFRIERNLAAGTYFVRVGSYGTATGTYSLHLTASGGCPVAL